MRERLDAVVEAVAPWTSPSGYYNFADRPGDADSLFDADTYARLRAVKRAVDPGDLIQAAHEVRAAAAQA